MSDRELIDGTTTAEEGRENAPDLATNNPLSPMVQHAKDFYATGQTTVYDKAGNPVHHYTLAPSPEWYNAHVKGREELLGWQAVTPERQFQPGTNLMRKDYVPNYKNFYQPMEVDPATKLAMTEAIAKHWDSVAEDPETMWLYQVHPMLLFADVELAARSNDALNRELDTASRTGSFITGQATSPFSYENMEDTLRKGQNLAWWLDDYIVKFDAEQQDSIAYLLSMTDINRRERIASIARRFWEEGVDPNDTSVKWSIDNPAHREEFINWLSRQAIQAQNESRDEMGAWNRMVFNPIDATFLTRQWGDLFRRNVFPNVKRILSGEWEDVDFTPGNAGWESYFDVDAKYDPSLYQYEGKVPDPKQWAYETNLTLGEQVAAANGFDYGSLAAGVTAGVVDAFMVVATPGDIAINLVSGGSGYASKIARVGLEPLTKMGRLRLAARVAIPVFGRRGIKATETLPRGIAARVGWAMRSRSVGEFMVEAEKRGVVRGMFDLVKARDIGGLVDEFPNMIPIVDSGVDDALRDAALADDYDMFWDVIQRAQAGAYEPTDAAKLDGLKQQLSDVEAQLNVGIGDVLKKAPKNADGVPLLKPELLDDLLEGSGSSGAHVVLEYKDGDVWRPYLGSVSNELGQSPAEIIQNFRDDIGDIEDVRLVVSDFNPEMMMFDPWSPGQVTTLKEIWANQHGAIINPANLPDAYKFGGGTFGEGTFPVSLPDGDVVDLAPSLADEVWANGSGQLNVFEPQQYAGSGPATVTIKDQASGPLAAALPDGSSTQLTPERAYSLEFEDDSYEPGVFDRVYDLGESHGLVDPDGLPVKRFVVLEAERLATATLHELAFDTLEEAVQGAFQIRHDIRLMGQVAMPAGSWRDDLLGKTGEEMEEFIEQLRQFDPASVVGQKYKSPFRDKDGARTFASHLSKLDEHIPLLTTLSRNETLNKGSAFTQHMAKVNDYLEGRVPLTETMSDNFGMTANVLEDSLLKAMQDYLISTTSGVVSKGEIPPEYWLEKMDFIDETGLHYAVGSDFEEKGRRMAEALTKFWDDFIGDTPLDLSHVSGTISHSVREKFVDAFAGIEPEIQNEFMDFLLRNRQDAWGAPPPGWTLTGYRPTTPDYTFYEPWELKDTVTSYGTKVTDPILIPFTSSQLEYMVERGFRYYAEKLLDVAYDLADETGQSTRAARAAEYGHGATSIRNRDVLPAVKRATDKVTAEWHDARLGNVIGGKQQDVREFMLNLVEDWKWHQDKFKGFMHYRFYSDGDTYIPMVRGGKHSNLTRHSSWTLNRNTATGFTGGGSSLGFGYGKLSDVGMVPADNMLRLLAGNNQPGMGDTWNEVIARRDKIKPVTHYRFPWRFGTGENVEAQANLTVMFGDLLDHEMDLTNPENLKFAESVQSYMDNSYMYAPNVVSGDDGMYRTTVARAWTKAELSDDGIDRASAAPTAIRNQRDQLARQVTQMERLNGIRAVVYDLPPLKTVDVDVRSVGELRDNDSARKALWRHNWARTMRMAMPEQIDLGDSVNSVYDVRRTLRALGASKATQQEFLTKFINAPKSAREAVVEEAFRQVGRDSGNKVLEHMVDMYFKNAAARRTSTSVAGATNTAEDLGQTAKGVKPPTPSHGGNKMVLPDESLFHTMARYRASGQLPKVAVRGLTGSTAGKRGEIVQALRAKVGPKVVQELGENADEELLRMAYAMISPDGSAQWDGVGYLGKALSRTIVGPWRWLHGTFTRSVLSLQPIRWMQKVALMEEPGRASLMGMPSFLINPKTSLRNTVHAFNISRYESHVTKLANAVDDMVAEFVRLDGAELDDFVQSIGMVADGNVTPYDVRRHLNEAFRNPELFDDSLYAKPGLAGAVQEGIKRGKQVSSTELKNIAAGLNPDFSWDDAGEIASKSMFSQYMTKIEGMRPVIYSPLKPEDHKVFTRQWASEFVRMKRDPFFELAGMHRYAQDKGVKDAAAARLRNHPEWPLYKQTALEIMDHKYPNGFSDLGSNLEDAYLAYLGEHVDFIMGPLVNGDVNAKHAVWQRVMLNDLEVQVGDAIYKFDLYDEPGVADNLLAMVSANRGTPIFDEAMPLFIDVPFTETFIAHGKEAEFRGGKRSPWRKFTDFMLQNFGERATQVMNRRPSYLWKHQQSYELFTELGMDDQLARRAAHRKAFTSVNRVYFNNDHIPPLIRKMNGIIPFFGAQVEIASTWAYKIPLAQGPFLGPVQLVRKIDKMFNGLVAAGILDVEYQEGDTTLGRQNARFRLSFEPGGSRDATLLGQFVSGAGYRMAEGVIGAVLGVRNMLSDEPDLEVDDVTGGNISFSFGNPLDWSKQNQGVLAVNSIYLTPTPGVKAAVSQLTRNLSITASNDVVAGGEFQQVLRDNQVDAVDFLTANRGLILSRYGKDVYDSLLDNPTQRFQLDPELGWEIPGTSMYDTFVKPWLYPMGFPDHEVYTWTEFIPSTWKYMMRGLAIGMGSEDPESFWNVDSETGELVVDGTFQRMMLPTAQDRYLASGQVWTSIQDYEARTGTLSKVSELIARRNEIEQLSLASREASRNEEGALLFDGKFGSEYELEWKQVTEEIDMLMLDILRAGFVGASNTLAIRGLTGFFMPATPRFMSDEQKSIASYWDAKENAESGLEYLYQDITPLGVTDVDTFNQLFIDFLEDRSGDQAIQTLRREMPELWAHVYGKSFWAADGRPAEIDRIDDFFAQIEDGSRQPFAPHVNLQRVLRAHVTASREAQILETYGDDPYEAAGSVLSNWFDYKENVLTPAEEAYDYLDLYDDFNMDGDYAAYRDIVTGAVDDEVTLQTELRRKAIALQDAIDDLEDLVPSLYDGAEGVEYAKNLSAISANIGDLAEQLGNDFQTLGIQNEREKVMSWFFTSQVAPYYERIGSVFEQLDKVSSDTEASMLFDQLRIINDSYGTQTIYNGKVLPSLQDWRWGRLSPEEQDLKLQEWIGQPVEWLDADAISRVIVEYPMLKDRLPSTQGAYKLMVNYGKAQDRINELASFDPDTGQPYLSEGDRRKAQDALEGQLYQQALNGGLGPMLEFMNMWPIERYGEAGLLPPSVEVMAGKAASLRDALQAAGKTPGQSDIVRNIIDPLYVEHVQAMRSDPVYAVFFRTVGRDLFDETDNRKIFDKFVLGDRSPF